jgi:hypothetical protein
MKQSNKNEDGEVVEDVEEEEEEVEVDVDDDDEMEEEVVEDDDDEMEEVMVDSSTEVEEEEEEEDVTEVEVDESEVFSDEGTTATPGQSVEEQQQHRPSTQEKVQEFEDWLWDSRRQPRSDSAAAAQSLASADVYTTSEAATGQEGDVEGDDDAFPTNASSSSFFAPTGTFGGDGDEGNRDSGGGASQPYHYDPAVSTTTTMGALASDEFGGGDDSTPYYHDDNDEDDGMTRDDDNTDTSTLLAVGTAQSPSDRFEDEPDSVVGKKERAAAGGVGTAAVATGAGAAAGGSGDDENHKPLRALGGLPLVDKVLIGLIVVVILILITVLPITLTRTTSRDVVPIFPTRAPTRRPSSSTLIPTAPPTTSMLRQYEVVGGPFLATPNSNLGAAVAALFGLNSTAERIVLAGAPNTSSGQGAVLAFAEQVAKVTRRKSRQRRTSTHVAEMTVGTQKGPTGLRIRNPTLQARSAQAAASQNGPWLNQSSLLLQQNDTVTFGTALYAAGSSVVVGSPGSANGGSAYVYQYVESGTASWSALGPALVGPTSAGNGTDTVSAHFGSAVAVASTSGGDMIVAVASPQYQQGDGAVYTYFYEPSTNAWQPLSTSTFPITTFGSSEQLGSALDISRDGEHLLVGAPNANGGMGRFVAYQWNVAGSEWLQVFEQAGTLATGMMGSSVVYLSGQREFVAVGAPGTLGGSGLVQLYQKSEGSLGYEQLGSDVTGQAAERLGAAGTIAGSVDKNGTALVVLLGTATGMVRRLDFDMKNNFWTTGFAAIDTGLSAPITALSSDEGGGTVVVGISSESTTIIYAESAAPASRSPTVAPATPAPTSQTPVSTLPPTTIAPNSTGAPTAPNSTSAPTAAPQPQWTQTGGPLSGSTSSFGTDVAIVQSFVAVGDPGSGSVYTYTRLNQEWIDLAQVSGSTQSGSLFGTSVVFNPSDNSLLVGAPGVFASNTQTPAGAAYYYTLSGSVWTQQGGPITGDSNVFAANEGFGTSVAVSRSGVVAVGAPDSNVGNVLGRGRVYTFAYDSPSSSWVRRGGNGTGPVGAAEGSALGSAVALSPDGSTLVAGAPGGASGAGSFSIYAWNGSAWNAEFARRGNSTTERLGTSVAVLSYDGGFVAVGGPGYGGGSGVIRVYQRQQQGFAPYGAPLVGEGGDGLGEVSSLSGSIDSSGTPTILAGSSSGAIKTLRYSAETSSWNETVEMVTTSLGDNPSLGGSTSLGLMVAGRAGVANIYALS